uniref:Putative secreted protein n=1 Tax=Rhipicephalus microplus TaxID=6941 RepID=A0A6G5A2D6_RHIMP
MNCGRRGCYAHAAAVVLAVARAFRVVSLHLFCRWKPFPHTSKVRRTFILVGFLAHDGRYPSCNEQEKHNVVAWPTMMRSVQ